MTSRAQQRTEEIHDSIALRRPRGARMTLSEFVAADPEVYVTIVTLDERPRMKAAALVMTHLWNYASGTVEVRHDGVYWLGSIYVRKVLAFDEYECMTCGKTDTAPHYRDMERRGWVFLSFDEQRWEERGTYYGALCPDHASSTFSVDTPETQENTAP